MPATAPPQLRAVLRWFLNEDPRRRLRDIGDARAQLEGRERLMDLRFDQLPTGEASSCGIPFRAPGIRRTPSSAMSVRLGERTLPKRHDSDCYHAPMRLRDAIDMLSDSGVATLGPSIWADLGCGEGTFTLALADLLTPGSTIHAMDRDKAALRRIPAVHSGVRIITHHGDFAKAVWPFADLDGILMANSLHYVQNQAAFVRSCKQWMKARRSFLIVEYDTSDANRWVPYPVSWSRLIELFEGAGYSSIRSLRSRPSAYRQAPLYAAAIDIGESAGR